MAHAASRADHRRVVSLVMAALFFIAAAIFYMNQIAGAARSSSPDPWGDSARSDALIALSNPQNASGAPDRRTVNLAGVNSRLLIDMGAGEEGTGPLRVHLGALSVQGLMRVEFLNEQRQVLHRHNRVVGLNIGRTAQNFSYNWRTHRQAYRYVRISSLADAALGIDAVQAVSYLASSLTQDTDGDGQADRDEQDEDSNPLVPNEQGTVKRPQPTDETPSTSRQAPAANADESGSTTDDEGNSSQVNDPPARDNDRDNDQIADEWEESNNLDRSNAEDAAADPDGDQLDNRTEYRLDSDPQRYDTDGDGLPDNWEHEHALNINRRDTNADPDGDYITNLGEFREETDPNQANDLSEFCEDSARNISFWDWLILALLLGGAGLSLLSAARVTRGQRSAISAAAAATSKRRTRKK